MKASLKKDLAVLLLAGLALTAFLYFLKEQGKTESEDMPAFDTVIVEESPMLMYGLPVDSFNLVRDVVRKNQNLSDILLGYNVDYLLIDKIAREWDSVFDVRKLRTGRNYTLFCTNDSVPAVKYFVYEHTDIDYVVFDFTDTISVFRNQKEIKKIQRTVTGVIETSLWNAVAGCGSNRMLALRLEDIYAWSIDFFGLQKGDRFRVIFEEQYVDSLSVGIGRIFCACFTHADSSYYAIPFVQDSVESYYDIIGNSLRKAFLKAPLKFSRISSRFSNSRLHPVLKIRRPHHGVDYAAPVGTPVMAIGDGKVILAGWSGGAGRIVKIKHNSIYTTSYMHLSKFGKGVKAGAMVKQGDLIGYVGSSGLSTGPHLDFRIYKNGTPVDPLKVEAPPVEPVKPGLMDEYNAVRDSLIRELDALCPESEMP
ncbi:MAG: peptidoglycan DD-metalloendopeptidase family protein [Bacteroidetes bacterium]|nr:peptidoglycan DD-metalloendopeptidase family protein [Bacteroidota bacterium]